MDHHGWLAGCGVGCGRLDAVVRLVEWAREVVEEAERGKR
jgi:hypothetical protein